MESHAGKFNGRCEGLFQMGNWRQIHLLPWVEVDCFFRLDDGRKFDAVAVLPHHDGIFASF